MTKILKNGIFVFTLLVIASLLQGCADADDEFVHSANTISQMACSVSHSGTGYLGTIYEFDKDGNILGTDFTQEQAEGGYGLIIFEIPKSQQDDFDLTNVYLTATLTYDEFITPSLSGRFDITGDGIIIAVKSGVNTVRYYRVRGEYQ
ncbi:hypothetical protein [Prevotella sp. KH2C16]|uniref:hypothetical protein n=1 Tax=Prevotella sp. KH2C16 TaxID=1855325 RepID=UPI0008E5057F|nr:hypothetical protein [Prevotella sp. KH2C16]SFG71993.1 hypothetical protein SAMN05216383_1333 [Prevotella sp. KH2C16]